ncbi:MAG: hypothetical protein WD768_09060 [Phycisphaeraceae bacterium]
MTQSDGFKEPAYDDAPSAPNVPRDVSSRKVAFTSVVSVFLAIILLMWVCSMAFKLGGMTKIFTKIFMDFDTELPGITLTALRIGPAGFIALSVFIAILLVVKEWLMRDKEMTLLINVFACAVALGMWFFLAQAMLTPLIALIHTIQK